MTGPGYRCRHGYTSASPRPADAPRNLYLREDHFLDVFPGLLADPDFARPGAGSARDRRQRLRRDAGKGEPGSHRAGTWPASRRAIARCLVGGHPDQRLAGVAAARRDRVSLGLSEDDLAHYPYAFSSAERTRWGRSCRPGVGASDSGWLTYTITTLLQPRESAATGMRAAGAVSVHRSRSTSASNLPCPRRSRGSRNVTCSSWTGRSPSRWPSPRRRMVTRPLPAVTYSS